MRHAMRLSIWLKIMALLLVLGAGTAVLTSHATPNGGYQINWWTTDSGGGTSDSATYTLSGTIAQHDVGATTLSGTTYRLDSGFWGDMDNNIQSIFLPLVTR